MHERHEMHEGELVENRRWHLAIHTAKYGGRGRDQRVVEEEEDEESSRDRLEISSKTSSRR